RLRRGTWLVGSVSPTTARQLGVVAGNCGAGRAWRRAGDFSAGRTRRAGDCGAGRARRGGGQVMAAQGERRRRRRETEERSRAAVAEGERWQRRRETEERRRAGSGARLMETAERRRVSGGGGAGRLRRGVGRAAVAAQGDRGGVGRVALEIGGQTGKGRIEGGEADDAGEARGRRIDRRANQEVRAGGSRSRRRGVARGRRTDRRNPDLGSFFSPFWIF
ncbi:hypothetical protein SETIT_5G462700v2, partial [Setaria italica]